MKALLSTPGPRRNTTEGTEEDEDEDEDEDEEDQAVWTGPAEAGVEAEAGTAAGAATAKGTAKASEAEAGGGALRRFVERWGSGASTAVPRTSIIPVRGEIGRAVPSWKITFGCCFVGGGPDSPAAAAAAAAGAGDATGEETGTDAGAAVVCSCTGAHSDRTRIP